MLDKFGVARALREIGALLEVEGENPFKVRAYENGARAVEGLADDLGRAGRAGGLTELPGIGEALAKKIAELHATGTTPLLERLRADPPARHPRARRASRTSARRRSPRSTPRSGSRAWPTSRRPASPGACAA